MYPNPDSLWIMPVNNPKNRKAIRPDLEKFITNKRTSSLSIYANISEPLFAPSGNSILFQWSTEIMRKGYYEYELYLMNLLTRDVMQLTHFGRCVTSPSFSSNGKEIVFLLDPNWPKGGKPFELWLMNSDGTNPHRVNVDLKNCLNCASSKFV
jgi:Tol biopolymer transport system component